MSSQLQLAVWFHDLDLCKKKVTLLRFSCEKQKHLIKQKILACATTLFCVCACGQYVAVRLALVLADVKPY